MSFVSISFLFFFLVFMVAYYRLRSARSQNLLVVIGSYFFYAFWDWRLLGLLVFSSTVDFWVARSLHSNQREAVRRALLGISIGVNLLLLGTFKYFHFFVDSLQASLGLVGLVSAESGTMSGLAVVLPIGISFYTFQTMGYTIDVYRGRVRATRDPRLYFAFVSFFPQLVAGPIERAQSLLPQLDSVRTFDHDGLRRSLWLVIHGYFLKVVVADSAAPIVDSVYVDAQPFGWSVVLGTALFGLQIYADFCGYSLIARGCAALLGIRLTKNFVRPYGASSIVDFWRRWHVSLSRWFRDYVYIPLGGNRLGRARQSLALVVTALLAGLWHGAAWHFVVWGAMHGIALSAAHALTPRYRLPRLIGWLATQGFVLGTWLVFRSSGFSQLRCLVSALPNLEWAPVHPQMLTAFIVLAALVALLDGPIRRLVFIDGPTPKPSRWLLPIQAFMLVAIVLTAQRVRPEFVYFQF